MKLKNTAESKRENKKEYDEMKEKYTDLESKLLEKDEWIIKMGEDVTKLNRIIDREKLKFDNFKRGKLAGRFF